MARELAVKPVYNDIIDEQIEFEDNNVLEEKPLRNQIIDGEVNLSDDSIECISTPKNQS